MAVGSTSTRPASPAPESGGVRARVDRLTRRVRPLVERVPSRLRFPLAVAGISFLLAFVWWAAYYPGLMSFDSYTYTWESTTGHWINDHSIPYITCVWLTLNITGTYALLTFCQIVAAALATGYLAAGLRKFRIRKRWIVGSVVLCGVLPPTGDFFVFVWKDVPFVLGALVAAAAVTHLVGDALKRPRSTRRAVPGRRRDWLAFGGGMLLLCLARNNGFLTVVLIGLVLLACLPWQWRRIAPLTVVPVLFYFFLANVIYPAVGVQPQVNNSAYSFFYADVAYAYGKNPSMFDQDQLAAMEAVAPLKQWKDAGCWDTDLLTQKNFSMTAAAAHQDELMSTFTMVLKKAPQYVADAHLCRAHNAWAVFPDHGIFMAPVTYTGPFHDSLISHPELKDSPFYSAFHSAPLSTTLHRAGDWWFGVSRTPQLQWILWGGAVWCYITYFFVVRLTRRVWRREILAIAATTAGLQLTVLAGTPAPLYRYMAAPTTLGVLLLPLASSKLKRDEPDSGTAETQE
ncbi:hypothetical protein [Streptacidiphilus rugosus]|uniref:hypothetical protein n=1 Tax=Streptacidiphilus rugosus TaxID=405783 RepID=UPI00055D95B9|nr:hypothetical protein [Streptacidiphilus rugosus]